MEMKRSSLIASAAMHVVLLGLGLASLSSPRQMDATASDAISVEFVPVEDKAQSVAGDTKAPLGEKPAPMPTERPEIVADAQNIGDNSVDSKAPPVPEARPKLVEVADAAKKQPKPTEDPKPEEVVAKEKPAVPATEVAPIPTPRQEVTPDPVKTADVRPEPRPEPQEDQIKKAIAEEEAKAAKQAAAKKAAQEKAEKQAAEKAAAELAEKKAEEEAKQAAEAAAEAEAAKEAAAKAAKEKAAAEAKAKAQKEAAEKKAAEAAAAKAKERKDAEKAAREAANKASDQGALEDDISKLLNKDKSGGGAKRSQQQAALGTKKTTGGKLSQNEEGALRAQIEGCWNPPSGIDSGSGLKTTLRAKVNPDKTIDGRPTIEVSSGNRAFDDSARRALMNCNNEGLKLPDGKEDIWADLVINFDPQDMLY
jgi:colicin import membrane protein